MLGMRNHFKGFLITINIACSFRIYEVYNESPNRTWILNVLPSGCVSIICVFMVMLSLASIIAQKIIKNRGLLGEELSNLSCFDHFFTTFAILCQQGNLHFRSHGLGNLLSCFSIDHDINYLFRR